MRRWQFISVITFMALFIVFPQISMAEGEANENNDENIIYGEDINELSEEQLQYIPKAWRDGNFQPEHEHEEEAPRMTPFRLFPDVNSYIEDINPVQTSYEYKDFFTKFPYRNGLGEVEGVVAHETANDNADIWDEISYMSRNHENAFVHAFVDHNHVIEIHPPDYGAWGAGRVANQRFVHVELTRVENFDQFAKSINNYADYITNILYDYNLGVSSAENSGKGTLWSHKAVSIHLGGTDHVDPHGYFARYGYNWSQFTSLVTERYNELVASKRANTSKLGHLTTGNVTAYNNPVRLSGSKTISQSDSEKVFYIKAEAVVKNKRYYLLSKQPSSKNGVIGWVEAGNLKVHDHYGVDRKAKTLITNGNGNAYAKAWGGEGDLVYRLSNYAGEEFKVNKTEKVGNNTWYRGTLSGKQVFIHEAYVDTYTESTTSRLGHLNGGAFIYPDLGNQNSGEKVDSNNLDKVYYIKKQANIGNERYYLISEQASSSKSTLGWVKASDMSTHTHQGVDNESKSFVLNGKGKAFTKAWGGEKDLVYNLSNYTGTEFKVHKTEKVGNNTWYRGYLDGERVFIHEAYVDTVEESATSLLGHLSGSATLYQKPADQNSSQQVSDDQLDKVYYIKKQADVGVDRYYLISEQASSSKGTLGWVKASDMSTHTHQGVDRTAKSFIANGKGNAYAKAWGGQQDLVYHLEDYGGSEFKVNKTETVGNNTWYRGHLGGKQVFIHEAYVDTVEESSTSRLGHLSSDATLYQKLGDSTSGQQVNADQLDKVYYIKKQANIGADRYYLISEQASSSNGTIGWVRANDISTHTHQGVDNKSKSFIVNGKGEAFTKAWGGAKDRVYNLSDYTGAEFEVHKTETVGNNNWYRGYLDGERVFIHEAYVNTVEESTTSRLGHLSSSATLYQNLGDSNSSQQVSAKQLDKVYYIKKQADIGGDRYYLISEQASSSKGTVGWVKTSDISTHTHQGVDSNTKTFQTNGKGKAFTKAWGGAKDLVYNLSDHSNQEFKVNKTETVGNNIWYRGYLDGKQVFIHEAYVK